jgi:hypothetical protein
MLAGEREAEATTARLTPVADERADRLHRVFVERRHCVQVESERSDAIRNVSAHAAQREGVRAGECAREVERGRAITDFERVL